MVWFEELQNRKKISKIFYRYEKTFPEEERRSKDQFLDLAENPDAFVYSINHEDENIGYCVIWELQEFYFLEHFEVFEEFRNQKFGEKILESLQEKFEKLILELEPASLSDIAERRKLRKTPSGEIAYVFIVASNRKIKSGSIFGRL